MNSRKILLISFLILISMQFAHGQNQSEKYIFPIEPGTKEWAKLKNNKEKVSVCQIPANQLKLLSTSELLETCLNYPLLPDIFAFNNMQDGFDKFKEDFNGIKELLIREDLSSELISKYKSVKPLDYDDNWSSIKKVEFSVDISFIEMFFSQQEVLKQLDKKEKQNLITELIKKYNEKLKSNIYGNLGFRTLAFCMANILYSEDYISNSTNDKIADETLMFAEKGGKITNEIYSNIIILSKQFKNE